MILKFKDSRARVKKSKPKLVFLKSFSFNLGIYLESQFIKIMNHII